MTDTNKENWKLAQSDNHKWEPEEPFASITTVRINFNGTATNMLDVGERYCLYTDSRRRMFKIVLNKGGRKLSDSSSKKTRCSMTYAYLGRELPPGRYFYVKGTKFEFKLQSVEPLEETT
jgi:hypothetical protein